jgi:hypothetical protein
MKLNRSCQDVTRLLLEGEDRQLALGERIGVRLHMLICAACPRFERQLSFMRTACARWRAYGESGDDAPPR